MGALRNNAYQRAAGWCNAVGKIPESRPGAARRNLSMPGRSTLVIGSRSVFCGRGGSGYTGQQEWYRVRRRSIVP